MASNTLVVGGTGPTGPAIVAGLEARGHDVTICHTGRREAVARTARWLADNPHPAGSMVERILEDPFDYQNEDG